MVFFRKAVAKVLQKSDMAKFFLKNIATTFAKD